MKIMIYLILIVSELNAQDNNGNTPLHVAVENEALDAIDFLLQQWVNF